MSITQITLDGGQSGIRTLVTDGDVTVPGPSFSGIRSDLPLLDQMAQFVSETLRGGTAEVVAGGVSGLGPDDTAARLKWLLGGRVTSVLLAHDSTTSYLGALGVSDGAVVAAGTGAVTLAVGPARVQRVDGWGHLLGDLGSGFWIGREALSAVLAAFDGRGPATSLTDRALEEFGDLSRLYLEIQADPSRVKRIASWARTVSEHTAEGDVVARSISERAGRLLADSVAAGLRTVGAAPRASHVGNVFRNPVVNDSFHAHLSALLPDVEIREPEGSGLDGAARLTQVPEGSPLGALVDRA